MKLNGIGIVAHFREDGAVCIETSASLADISTWDGATLTVTEGDETVAVYHGYGLHIIEKTDTGTMRVWFTRDLGDSAKKAIESIEGSMAELSSAVSDAAKKADEAKEAAAQAGTSPSVKAASVMYINTVALTNSQISDVRDLIEDFVPGTAYGKGLVRRHNGAFYRMAQNIDAQTSTTYQPGPGTESLYTLIDLAPDGVRVWHAPTCAEDSFELGERAHYPDADGAVYISGREGNTSVPGTDEWWTLEGGGE